MQIEIQAYSAHNRHNLNCCEPSFVVDSKLVLHAENDHLSYTVVSVPPYTKQYPYDESGLESRLAQMDKGIFFAYADGELAGQIILFKNWNGYAYINDLVVEKVYRRQGVGRALIQQAIAWAKERQLPGIMLETQNINVAACRLYERCGFELGGFDRYLYRGIDAASEEIALTWYLLFT